MPQVELLLRGLAIGALAVTAMGLWLSGAGRNARVAGLMFCITIIAYLLLNSDLFEHARGALVFLLSLVANATTACVWLFVLVVFEDRRVTWATLSPAFVLIGLAACGLLTQCSGTRWIWIVYTTVSVVLALHGLYVIVRGWRGDLVEARRALRGPFLAIAAGYTAVQSVVDAAAHMGLPTPWGGFGNACIMAVLCIAGAFTFLQAKAALFGAPALKPRDLLAPPDHAALDRLSAFMEQDEGWRRENLTIAEAAQAVQTPEHRLRRLINDHMGHRNFQAFVNAYRIEAAKRELVTGRQPTIAAVAFDMGFGSLGPFNRAFREATGLSPREWRKQAASADA